MAAVLRSPTVTAPIRVVHVVVAGDVGGAEKLLVDLASRPDVSGVDHAVALMTPNEELARLFRGAGLRVHDRGRVRENPVAYLWRSLGPRDVRWVERVLREERAAIAHLHTFASHVVGSRAARRAGARILRTEHHVQYFVDPSCSPFTRWSLRRADAVVAISEYVRAFVVGTAPYVSDKIRVVRNGVDAERFSPRPHAAPADASVHAGVAPLRFVVVCRLERWKEVHLVLEALARVDDARLDVVGDGSERRRLERIARTLGVADRVTFLGYVRDPRELVAAADVAVSSSRDEPLGLSVLEAEAMGLPVVAFAGGGIAEIVRDGETGWLVRDRSAVALAAAMRAACVDRARVAEMGRAARARVLAEHRVETMCAGYARVYAELAAW
jgi:glycosyltransferase involved in cell wall biosynthesis